jgi:hypothetical protein
MPRLPARDLQLFLLGIALSAATATGGAVLASRGELSRGHDAATAIATSLRAADARVLRVAEADGPASVSIRDAVAVTYLERHRLGLGSPFRLIDQVGRDRRLSPEGRREIGWAILARTLRGDGYAIDTLAISAAHLQLIEQTIADATSPEVGELTVRLAYRLAASERVVSEQLSATAGEAAALVRDRWTAQRDARRLITSARAGDVEALALVPMWREQRRFAVESPSRSLSGSAEERAIGGVEEVLSVIRGLPASAAQPSLVRDGGWSMLTPAAAERLGPLSANYLPPQSAVVLAIRTHADLFADTALNEETLVTQRATTAEPGKGARRLARATLAAGAGLRAHAQEVVWLPGSPGPSDAAMRVDLPGVTVQFDPRVREAWQPYYRKMLVSSVRDLRRVLPGMTLDGLRVRFIEEEDARAALALHDPAKRTLYLPIRTAAGVLAHELAHDLDWQASRRLYNRRGSYSTDIALDEGKGALSERLKGLASATLVTPRAANGWYAPHDRRPAEVFARNFDWLVAAALSRDGRSNGYLSSVQDEVLVGHAAVLPREVGGSAVGTLVDLVEVVTTPLAGGLRDWLVTEWGGARARRPNGIVRAVADASLDGRRSGVDPWYSVPDRRGGCVALARLAAESRARGLLRDAVVSEAGAGEELMSWGASIAGRAPWSASEGERAVDELTAEILRRAAAAPGFPPADCGDALALAR